MTPAEINKFEQDARQWVTNLIEPFPEAEEEIDTLEWFYTAQDVTPYMHAFANHFPDQMSYLATKGLTHRFFSAAPVEKKNHIHVKAFFRSTRMDGGGGKKSQGKTHTTSAIMEIMERENRQLYYVLNNTSTKADKGRIYNMNKVSSTQE